MNNFAMKIDKKYNCKVNSIIYSMKKTTQVISLAIVTILVIGIIVFAGSLNPSSTPTPSGYTLGDVYNLIVNNSTTTASSHSLATSTSPALTFHSTSEIYALLANLIQRENVQTGITYLGITGNLNNPDPSRQNVAVITSSLSTTSAPAAYGYSLNDIYHLIADNTTANASNHALSNESSPASTMHSITDIYNALTNLIVPATIKVGTTYLGKAGVPVALTSIAITSPADKIFYTVGDTLDLTGLVVVGTYNNNSTSTETITADNITGFDTSVASTSQTLLITVGGKTATYSIVVDQVYSATAYFTGTVTNSAIPVNMATTTPAGDYHWQRSFYNNDVVLMTFVLPRSELVVPKIVAGTVKLEGMRFNVGVTVYASNAVRFDLYKTDGATDVFVASSSSTTIGGGNPGPDKTFDLTINLPSDVNLTDQQYIMVKIIGTGSGENGTWIYFDYGATYPGTLKFDY